MMKPQMCDGQAHVRSVSRFQGVVQPFVGDHCVKQLADIIIRIEYTPMTSLG